MALVGYVLIVNALILNYILAKAIELRFIIVNDLLALYVIIIFPQF